MKMTDVERITLIRLHEILSTLRPKEAKRHHAAIEVLRDGYHEDLYEQTSDTYLADAFPAADQMLVYDILDLYAKLHHSYTRLPKAERKDIDKAALRFQGFDEASEAAHLAFARFVLKSQHRSKDLAQKSVVCAKAPMIEEYNRLLAAEREIQSSAAMFTREQIQAILAKGTPPKPRRKKAKAAPVAEQEASVVETSAG